MLITIYDKAGNPKVELSPNDSSTQVTEIQGDNVLTLSFTHYEHIDLDVDDYADFEEERYWLTEKYRPKQKSTKEWSYDIKLYGVESMIKRLLVIKTVDNEEEPVFTLTAPPRDHVAMIVKCMNNGMGNITDWKVGQVNGTENIVIDYFGKYCDEALKEIAEKVSAEWWVEGQTVNICKCEHGEQVELGYNKGLLSIDPGSADNVKFYTRLYPVGSSRNIDPEKYGFTRLQLPGGQKYVEINADKYGRVDHFEQAAFEDIYPRRVGVVSSVRSEVRTGEDGNPFTIYYFTDNNLPFDPNDYMIGGLVIRVSFQEGSELAGLGEEEDGTYFFEVNFNSTTREFEIITIWPYDNDTQLPGDKLVPKAGDKYILWNLRMPDEYYALAEEEFLTAVNKYNADHNLDISVYKAPTDHVWFEDNNVKLTVGRRVRLVSDEYFPGFGFRDSRITKITRKVNLPSSMDIEISDTLSRTSLQKLSDSISDVRDYARSIQDSFSLPDIIRTGDRTRWTDNNLLSALRSQREFLSKLKDDRAKGKIASDLGFEVGNYLAGVSGGMFGMDRTDGQSFAEVFRLYVRGKAFFETLTIIEAATLAGRQYITPGGSIKCSKVEEVRDAEGNVTAYRCWFLSEQDGEKTETKIIPGDQAISEMFNARTGTANKVSNHRYWRLVTAVDNDAEADSGGNRYGYIDLSATDCEADSDIPKAGDVIEQFGNRTDKTRQAAMMFDTVGPDAPSLKMLTGIDSYTLEGKDVISQGYDHVKGHAFMKVYGDTYIGAPDGSTYIRYDQDEKKVIVRADLEVQSTIGGQSLADYITALIPELKREDIEGFVNAIVNPLIAGVQNQLDGVIETWFHNGAPSLTSYPASDWVSDADREKHLGDLYFDNDTGLGYRFSQDDSGNYYWNDKVDSATAKALAEAAKAQDTADSKRRIFTSQPAPPYEEGDLWVNATYPAGTTPDTHDPSSGKYCDDILRCFSPKASGEPFAISDWGLSSNYTDDTLARAAQLAAAAAQQAAETAQNSVSDLNTYVDGAFKDGIITQTEATAIAGYINTVNSAKAEITATYNKLKDNAYLPPAGKNQLKTAYDNVDAAITSLIGAINTAIADGKITEAEKTAVNNAFATFNTRNAAFRSAVEAANEAIQKVIKSAADAAQQAADNAAEAAQAAKDRLDAWAEDGVISPVEKQEIGDEIARIKGDYSHIHAECDRYGLTGSEATNYYSAYGAYLNALEGILASTEDCVPIPDNFAARQTSYYTARSVVLSAIAAAAKKYADDAAERAIAGYKYLTEAFGDVSKTFGAVFLTGHIRVGVHNSDFSTQTVWGGLNGVYTASHDISYWAGGDCLDLFKPDGITRKTQAELGGAGARPAQALFRMDGSGYLLGGDVQFRPDRAFILGTDDSAITMKDGHLTLGNGISINIGGEAKGLGDSIASLTNLLNTITNEFDPVYVAADGSVTVKSWANVSQANAIRANKAFFSADWLSGYGVSGTGAAGGGGIADMLTVWADYSVGDATTKALSAGLGYDLHTRLNALAAKNYLDALTLVTNGSGNAVTDVTLSTDKKTLTVNRGANFLTEHQSLANRMYIHGAADFDPATWDGYYAGMTTHSGVGGDWWHILSMNWGTGTGNVGKTWVSQLALPTQQRNGVYYRSGASASAYSPWVRLLDEGNYASILGSVYQPKGDYVTLGTAQTITGTKTFGGGAWILQGNESNEITTRYMANITWGNQTDLMAIRNGIDFRWYNSHWVIGNLRSGGADTAGFGIGLLNSEGKLTPGLRVTTSGILAASFIRSGGTSAQFLMADGSVNSNAYALATHGHAGYLQAAGRHDGTWNLNTFTDNVIKELRSSEQATTNAPFYGYGVLVNFWDANRYGALQLAGSGDNQLYFRSKQSAAAEITSDWRRVIDSSNYSSILDGRYYTESEINTLFALYYNKSESDSRFVNVTGDTMTGALKVPSIELTTISGIKFTDNILGGGGDVAKMYITGTGEAQQLTFEVQNDADDIINFITPDNNGLKKNGNTILHAGNYASILNSVYLPRSGGSMNNTNLVTNLNADLLDGAHKDWFFRYNTELNASDIDINTISYHRSTGITVQPIHFPNYSGITNKPFNEYGQMLTFGGYESFFPFRLAYQQAPRLYLQSGGYKTTETFSFNGKDWHAIAFLTDNVASATKLQTARTIWGQSFDGTGNVSGALSEVSAIHFVNTGSYFMDSWGNFRATTDTDANHWQVERYDGTPALSVMASSGNVGIGTTSPGAKLDVNGTAIVRSKFLFNDGDAALKIYGITNSTSPSGYGRETVAIQTGFDGQDPESWSTQLIYPERVILSLQPRGGRVAIGKDNAAYPLDVNGDAIVRGWLRTTGANGWYSETYGGGWYMSDSTWLRVHNNKNIYQGTGTIRTDGQLQVGDSGSKFLVSAAGQVKAAGEIISTSAYAFRAVQGNYGVVFRNTGDYSYLQLTASGNQYGGAAGVTPIQIAHSNGSIYFADQTIRAVKGYVGINCNPTYNFDVNGDARVTAKLYVTEIVFPNGIKITADAANKALKISGGGLYSDSYISAYGVKS